MKWFGSILLLLTCTGAAPAAPVRDPVARTETLWRGTLREDSLFVRATWIPTRGTSTCIDFMSVDDTLTIRPKYAEYRIETSRGAVQFSDTVAREDFFCCDGLSVDATPWHEGLILQVTASGWGCEPAGDCTLLNYVFIPGSGKPAASGWTGVEWDPADDRPTTTMVNLACLEYAMPARPLLRGASLMFEPLLPVDAGDGSLLEKPVVNYCTFWWGDRGPATISAFRTADGKAPEPLVVSAATRLEILSVVLRVARQPGSEPSTALFRVQIKADGRPAYVTPEGMKALGLIGF